MGIEFLKLTQNGSQGVDDINCRFLPNDLGRRSGNIHCLQQLMPVLVVPPFLPQRMKRLNEVRDALLDKR